MKQVYQFDSKGKYIEPVLIEDDAEIPANCTEMELPQPCWKPIFNGTEWVETITEEELFAPKKASKLAEINTSYANELTAGFITNATGTPIRFKYAEIDQINFSKRTNAVALGTSNPSFPFGTADGVITFTIDQWKVIAKDAENHEMAVYEKLVSKRNEVENATIDTINTISW